MPAVHEIVYPMSTDYVAHWDSERALAELVANAFDEDPNPTLTHNGETLVISDRGSGWTEDVFILGKTSKTSQQIGQFGEGLKLALLVLAREHRNPVIETAGRTITAHIEPRTLTWDDAPTAHPLLCIRTCRNLRRPGRPPKGTRITVTCSAGEAAAIQRRFLRLNDRRYRTPVHGRVLTGVPGNVYVGGVLIAGDRDLTFGYDFPLEAAKHLINRDRDIIDGWELETLIGDTLARTGDREVVTSYLRAAFEGSLSSSETSAARRLGRHPSSDRLWRAAARTVIAERYTTPLRSAGQVAERVYWDDSPDTRDVHYSLADRQWLRIPITVGGYHHRDLMTKIGVRHIATIARQRDQLTWVARKALTDDERRNLSLLLRRFRRSFPDVDAKASVRVFDHHENAELLGFYEPTKDLVAVRRDRLACQQTLAETLVHEFAHRRAHQLGRDWQDRTRGFEQTLSEFAAAALRPARADRAPGSAQVRQPGT